jgi:hypothetical protein
VIARGTRPRRISLRGRLSRVALLALLALILVAGVAQAFRLVAGDIVLVGTGGFSPTALPQNHYAPIEIHGGGSLSTVTGDYPPVLKTITIEYDRHGSVQTKGLPICTRGKLTNTTVTGARHNCPGAIVGEGFGRATVVFPDSKPIPASSPITVFNGPKVHGQNTVFGHAYTTVPAPTTFIVPVVIEKIHEGRYGYRTTINIPPIAGGYGIPLSGHIKIDRKWTYRKHRYSFINASCPDGHLQARGKFDLSDGKHLSGTFASSCTILR